ncbi:MAG: vancomycin resistance protein, partial [Clostridia bacterium]|nr:vancomycin resistance protein [Clostridia bacterium]
ISEGWIDVKARNDTDCACQIIITFDDNHIIGTVLTDIPPPTRYKIENGPVTYTRKKDGIYESVNIERVETDTVSGEISGRKLLYTNTCKICYPLAEKVKIEEACSP